MKNQVEIYSLAMCRCAIIFFLLFLNYSMAQTSNNQNCWIAVGNTGIVDPDSKDVIKFGPKLGEVFAPTDSGSNFTQIRDNGGVAYLSTASKGTYHIRYAINQQFIFNTRTDIQLHVRYKVLKNDRIIVNLNRYKLHSSSNTEKIETILTFDSDSFLENLKFQTQRVSKRNVKFDFKNFGYYIDVQLIVNSTNSSISDTVIQPVLGIGTAIGLIQICSTSIVD